LHPVRREKRAAICIPWCLPDHTLVAIQHRFIDPELAKPARYRRKPGSQPL
jgi:hypothetical protein